MSQPKSLLNFGQHAANFRSFDKHCVALDEFSQLKLSITLVIYSNHRKIVSITSDIVGQVNESSNFEVQLFKHSVKSTERYLLTLCNFILSSQCTSDNI